MRIARCVAMAVVGVLSLPRDGVAATFCVDTAAELQAALSAAVSNGEADVIRIKAGTYATSSGDTAFSAFLTESFSLSLLGGYRDVGMFPCLTRNRDPRVTVISGSDARRGMSLPAMGGTSGDLLIEGLTFSDGLSADNGGGLTLGGLGGHTGDVTVDRVFFDRNVSTAAGGGLAAGADGGILTLRNSLFRGNRANNNSAASLTVNAGSPTNYRAFVGNNTVVANSCNNGAPNCTIAGIRAGGNARYIVFNNAFAFNTETDLIGPANFDLINNNVPNFSGTPVAMSGNTILTDPGFVNPFGVDYRLRFDSPLRNAGAGGFALGNFDFNGDARLNDGQFDVGAFENDEIVFAGGFETLQ